MISTQKYTQEALNKILWAAADSSRTQVDAGIYKDYVLAMLFFKYLSDLSQKKYEQFKERFGEDEERIKEKMKINERGNSGWYIVAARCPRTIKELLHYSMKDNMIIKEYDDMMENHHRACLSGIKFGYNITDTKKTTNRPRGKYY